MINIPRELNLGTPEDRAALVRAFDGDDELRRRVELHLDNYLRWFRDPQWRLVYGGGLVSGPKHGVGAKRSSGYTIAALLRTTEQLAALEGYDGFPRLVESLDNPTQVRATVFEVQVAAWCVERAVHSELTFGPEVHKSTGPKYPEFLWRTSLGELFCECKQENQWERKERRRVSALLDAADSIVREFEDWPADLRVDLLVEGSLPPNAEKRLEAGIEQLHTETTRGSRTSVVRDGPFTLRLSERTSEPQVPADTVVAGTVRVDDKPTRLSTENSQVTVARSLSGVRGRIVGQLVKDAKSQLPEDRPCGVFLEMSGAELAAQRLKEMLAHPSHRNLAWACVWTAGVPQSAVWQTGQPFDERLLT